MDISNKILSDITVFMKYAKHKDKAERRETWEELVQRNKVMHQQKYKMLNGEIDEAYELVQTKRVLPSMRSMQFAGKPIQISPNRIYNCGYIPVDDWRAFGEILFLLLGGTGIGFSVQKHHIEQLPEIRKPKVNRNRRFLVGDSIEGWADAIKVLMRSYFEGSSNINFDFSDIRPKGARLITSGGKAPGPEPLKICIRQIKSILNERDNGDQLEPIEVHDIICHIADAVLAGGIRRAALISLFSADDKEMIAAKAGRWWEKHPQRARANNSAAIVRHRVRKKFFMGLWERIRHSGAGEPGIYFTNDKDWGTNPSLRKGTKVLTTKGIEEIQNLQDKEFFVKNLNGQISKAQCWLSGKDKQLYKLKLRGGHEYYATVEHEWPVWNGKEYVKVSSDKLEAGNLLPVIRENKLFDGDLGTYEDGFVIGWQYGDGWISERSDNNCLQHGFIVSQKDCEYGIDDRIEKYLLSIGSKAKFSQRGNTKELNTICNVLNENIIKFNNEIKPNLKSFGLPNAVWTGSEEFRKGIVNGLFSSDGHIEKNKKRIVLTTKHKKLAEDTSELLGFYGIKSSIKKSDNYLPITDKSYQRYDVRITEGASIKHFRNLFKLSVGYKQEQLDSYEFPYNIKNDTIEILEIEKTDLYEDVWDISVQDTTHCFQIAHCITGNCCEIGLRPFQFCNLCEVNVSDVKSQEDLNQRVRTAAFLGTLQAGYTEFHYLRPIWQRTTEKEALLGVSLTGIASDRLRDLDLQEAAKIAVEENKKVAEMIGIKPAARVTTIKPAGTSSMVLGCSSGIHAWHNNYYIRRLRVGKNEDIYHYLSINHPELIEDEYFRPHDTAIISVPQKAPEGSILRHETAKELLERVKWFSENWIQPGHVTGNNTHNISATISIKEGEWDDVGEWMWKNREYYNGLAVLPHSGGNYIQPPFEDCDEATYNKLMKNLTEVDLTKIIEQTDNTNLSGEIACSGGACEVKYV